MPTGAHQLPEILRKYEADILKEWLANQEKTLGRKIKMSELNEQSREFLQLLTDAAQTGDASAGSGAHWQKTEQFLGRISKSRGEQGFSPSETAQFVMSLKAPVFERLKKELGSKPEQLVSEVISANSMFDRLALFTTEVHQRSREEVILRQQADMMELSTPVVKLWDGVLALPLIGTLDSGRTQVVMESLLQKIVETNSEIAIIDITGVPTVDTLVAQHLMKTVTAARLMGAECVISGIRPQIAATIVHLGVELGGITTKATLADAFSIALSKTGKMVVSAKQVAALQARAAAGANAPAAKV